MKLRFRKNSLRLRVNQREVQQLASADTLAEAVEFPRNRLVYTLEATSAPTADAVLQDNAIRVLVPASEVQPWAANDEIGLYYQLATDHGDLKIAVEKDLECVEGPEEERDPDAFPRATPVAC